MVHSLRATGCTNTAALCAASELIAEIPFDKSCRRTNEMLMPAKVDEFEAREPRPVFDLPGAFDVGCAGTFSSARPAAERGNSLAAIRGVLRIDRSARGCADLLAFELSVTIAV